jgi:hypothetical protein
MLKFFFVLVLVVWVVSYAPTPLAAERSDDAPYPELVMQQARERALWTDRQWLLLLHYKKTLWGAYQSEEDGPDFFASPKGKYDPQAELLATIEGFFANPADIVPPREHPQCVFPARYKWLVAQLGIDPGQLPKQPCERLDEWLTTLHAEKITLIFASFYMNNPASMFGHTFLRVDATREGPDQPLLNFGVNYAANADTSNIDPFSYVFKGLFGFFPGTFTIFPYYAKVQEYSNWESRDLWEYELNLTKDQVDYFLLHLWELGGNYFDYYYFQENCSYHILSLLEVANPDLHLTDRFAFQVIPSETVKVVVEQAGLVSRRTYRPSILSQMNRKWTAMSEHQRHGLLRLAHDPAWIQSAESLAMPPNELAPVLDAYLDYAQYRGMQDHPNENRFNRDNNSILLARARLGVIHADADPAPVFSTPPELGHGSAHVGLGYGGLAAERFEEFTIRPAYHDVLANDVGYNRDSQILFFDTTVRRYHELDAVRLESFKLLDIISLTPFDPLFRRMSWKLSIGVDTIHDLPCGGCRAAGASYGLGGTYSPRPDAPLRLYGLVSAHAQYAPRLGTNYRLGGGATVGILWDLTSAWRAQVVGDYVNFGLGHRASLRRLALVQRYALGRNVDVRLNLGVLNEQRDWLASANVYF